MSDGRLIIIGGASRSGKTAYVKKQIKGERRVMVWDVEDQFSQLPGYTRITSHADLLKAADNPGGMRIAFVPGG